MYKDNDMPTDETKLWSKLGEHDKQIATIVSDIRGIFGGLEEIRDVLNRIQESNRPNIGGMVIILIAVCGFLVTVGSLTMAPVYRDLTRMYQVQDKVIERLNGITASRFTNKDAEALEDKLRTQSTSVHSDIYQVLQQHEEYTSETRERVSKIEGYIDGFLEGRAK